MAVKNTKRLVAYLRSNRSYKILGSEGTWNAGGCSLLAVALGRILGRRVELLHIASDKNQAEHAVVRVGTQYIDADGAHTKDQMLHKMIELEGLSDPHLVPFDLDRAIANHVYSEEQVEQLTEAIRKVFGKK